MAAGFLETASWLVGSIAVRSARFAIQSRRWVTRLPAEDLTLRSADGSSIAATYWSGRGPASPAVLMVPGLGTTRQVIAPNAVWFAAQGYAVLTIDMRGHGDSSPALHSFGWYEALDVHAAFDWLKQRQSGAKVAALGISMGGAALLLGEQGPVPADALVLQAVFADIHRAIRSRIALVAGSGAAQRYEPLLSNQAWRRLGIAPQRLAPITVLPNLTQPVLVIGGSKDRFTPPEETRALYHAANEPKALWIAADLGHKGISDTIAEAYRARVLDFLSLSIGPPDA